MIKDWLVWVVVGRFIPFDSSNFQTLGVEVLEFFCLRIWGGLKGCLLIESKNFQ